MAIQGLSDNDGYDEGFDPFREEFPEHTAKPIAELIPKDLLRAWESSDPPQPASKPQKCGKCFKQFTSKATWWYGKWRFSSLCSDCTDGNTLPPGFLGDSKRPAVKQMACPKCGITRGVEARLRYNLWNYELICPNCGTRAVIHSRIRRACVDCAEDFYVNEHRPIQQCHKCASKTSAKPKPY